MKRKTIREKFQIKLNNFLEKFEGVTLKENKIIFKKKTMFSFQFIDNEQIKIVYGKERVAFKKIKPFYTVKYSVEIFLTHDNFKILGSNLLNPPYGINIIYKLFDFFNLNVRKIIFGLDNNFEGNILFINNEFYNVTTSINREEKKGKNLKIRSRMMPFLKSEFELDNLKQQLKSERDYKLLLKEILSSGKILSSDIIPLTQDLTVGQDVKIVINQQIEKQAEWLLSVLRVIVNEKKLTKVKAREFGKKYFHYPKNSITGPEHLMEKILTDYGQNIIFGVPALLNTNKYVVGGLSKVQFDLILIDTLSDIEIVELKRTDARVLDYDSNRNKFYPSKTLSIAIGQSERYITTIYKDDNEKYKINGKTIKDFISNEVGGIIEIAITRPSALIIIGAIERIVKPYNKLSDKDKRKITEEEYYKNAESTYRELRNTHKNIKIITYSELIEAAELRLKKTEEN